MWGLILAQWRGLRLEGEALGAARGGRELFAGVRFTLAGGEALLVAGANGAGKTTLIRALAGLGRFATGTVRLTGGAEGAELAEETHYVGHSDAVKPQLTVAENLAFWRAWLGGAPAASATNEADTQAAGGALAALSHIPAQFLSAGQRRRLALARLHVAPRPLWLLDEPAVSLDADARTALAGEMSAHLSAGGMIVAASHTDLGIPFAATVTLGTGRAGASGPSGAGGEYA